MQFSGAKSVSVESHCISLNGLFTAIMEDLKASSDECLSKEIVHTGACSESHQAGVTEVKTQGIGSDGSLQALCHPMPNPSPFRLPCAR